MKKTIISLILAVAMLASMATSVFATSTYGDINDSSTIDSVDALMILRYAVSALELSDYQLKVGDVDGNNVTNAIDSLLILKYSVGLIDTFPVVLGKDITTPKIKF